MNRSSIISIPALAAALAASAHAGVSYGTSFDSMSVGTLDGQDGWQESSSSLVARVSDASSLSGSNAFLLGSSFRSSFVSNTYAPALSVWAGESGSIGTTLGYDIFTLSLSFRGAGAFADGSVVSFAADDGNGNSAWSVSLRNESNGISVTGWGFDSGTGTFTPSFSVSGLARDEWQHLQIVTAFNEGADNDTVAYSLNGGAVTLGNTWEDYFRSAGQFAASGSRPYAVNRVVFSSAPSSAGAQGFFFDNLMYSAVPAPGAVALLAAAGLVGSNRRRA